MTLVLPPQGGDPRQIARIVNDILQGKLNATMAVTLTPNAGTTTLSDARITASSFIGLCPLTANAAGAIATTYPSTRAAGSVIFTHANNSQADKTFIVLVIG